MALCGCFAPSPRTPPAAHSVVSRGSPTVRPSHKAALSFAPHWHALVVMCSGEWLCSSTTFKGNEVPGWVAKVWLPGYGIHILFSFLFLSFFLGGSAWVCFSKCVKQTSNTFNSQLSWKHCFVFSIKHNRSSVTDTGNQIRNLCHVKAALGFHEKNNQDWGEWSFNRYNPVWTRVNFCDSWEIT